MMSIYAERAIKKHRRTNFAVFYIGNCKISFVFRRDIRRT